MESLQMGEYVGVRAIVECALNDVPRVRNWCLKHNTSFALELNRAVDGQESAWSFVAGHQYQFPDYPYYHLKAFETLLDSAALLTSFCGNGIILLLDEAENVSRQHDIRGRRKTYDTLGRFADERHLFTVLFVTDRFFGQLEDDRQRGLREGWEMWTPAARRFLTRVNSVPLATPPRLNTPMAKMVVQKVGQVYSQAFSCSIPEGFYEEVLNAWHQTATKSVRLLVRIAIDALDRTVQ
jgi:hypothetical protein